MKKGIAVLCLCVMLLSLIGCTALDENKSGAGEDKVGVTGETQTDGSAKENQNKQEQETAAPALQEEQTAVPMTVDDEVPSAAETEPAEVQNSPAPGAVQSTSPDESPSTQPSAAPSAKTSQAPVEASTQGIEDNPFLGPEIILE